MENGLVPSAGDKNGVQAADTLRVRVDEAEVDLPRPDPGRDGGVVPLVQQKVDAIITNRPDLCRRVVDRYTDL